MQSLCPGTAEAFGGYGCDMTLVILGAGRIQSEGCASHGRKASRVVMYPGGEVNVRYVYADDARRTRDGVYEAVMESFGRGGPVSERSRSIDNNATSDG